MVLFYYRNRIWSGDNPSVIVGERIVFNISQGRKIFKFMKFLEPLRKIHEESILKRGKPMLIRGLSILDLVCAFFLYISDNMVWFANMGLIKAESRFAGIGGIGRVPMFQWAKVKDMIALWKNVIELVKYIFDARRYYQRQE